MIFSNKKHLNLTLGLEINLVFFKMVKKLTFIMLIKLILFYVR